ncbi:chymotrypsin-1-like [Onthophagus taurus]|uniref:chymotrypsin-1-like n=1 Tax=Onthophagus taurus TaxID=166361 RepID=UPI000C208BD8|nr:chymotrypsin-1-like [Onthophagus taurus]
MVKFVVAFSALFAVAFGYAIDTRIDDSFSWRVVGGANAAAGQFPYQISLRGASGSHTCGGSILSANWILTAAHCVYGGSASSYTVVTGSTTLNSGGDRYSVSRIIAHSGYNPNTVQNDIAVLQVSSPIQFNNNVQAIEPDSTVIGAGDCIISGWGTTSYPGSVPNNLQFLALKTITNTQCQSAWGSNSVFDSNICTLTKSGEGVCHGDSGGPLAANGKQIGIVSWGNPCARGTPDVFTRVSSFIDWINTNTK